MAEIESCFFIFQSQPLIRYCTRCNTLGITPDVNPPNEDFKASVQYRLPQLSPRIYHISNKPLSFMIQSGYWKEKKKSPSYP